MVLYENLYVADSLQKNKDKIIEMIKKGKPKLRLYVVALAFNPVNLLEIIYYNELLQPYYKEQEIHIIGIASSKEEAMDMVKTIIASVYHNTQTFDVRKYLGYDD